MVSLNKGRERWKLKMEAKDTVMTEGQILNAYHNYTRQAYYNVAGLKAIAEDQAEISFKAGVEAGWIDPAKVIMPGEFGTPKAKEILAQWAKANGYHRLAEDQEPPPNCPDIISFGDMIEAGWRKVIL